MTRRTDGSWLLAVLMAGLFCSGAAGIVNQVVWQRALKVFLGGSETLSAMTVVLVFMMGIGAGSALAGRWASRLRNPLETLAYIEAALCGVNFGIAHLLSLDVSESIYAFERSAVAIGIPIRAVYVLGATGLLLVPCLLMGMTVPVSSEACQGQLGRKRTSLIGILFGVNTGGAVLGAAVGAFYLLPWHGQFLSLVSAAGMNAIAAFGIWALAWKVGDRNLSPQATAPRGDAPLRQVGTTSTSQLGFALGFLSLGYEMYLVRANTLLFQPVPKTFAMTLGLFLLFWSIGTLLSAWRSISIAQWLVLGAAAVAAVPFLAEFHRWQIRSSDLTQLVGLAYYVPCLAFGALYGRLAAESAHDWGRDVGKFAAWNTVGSCLGVLAFTLLGYEITHEFNAWIIATALLAMLVVSFKRTGQLAGMQHMLFRVCQVCFLLAISGLLVAGVSQGHQSGPVERAYYGRDGVVEIFPGRVMCWDGLEHSFLSKDGSHIGDNNWHMATVPVLCHASDTPEDVLVIGLGTGITAGTIAMHPDIKNVDVYEINHTLKRLHRDFPQETLNALGNAKIQINWQDGRSGLALNKTKYDIITQQPLYLMQAGSGILLSKEYMELVQSRLKPGGVFCIYSYSFDNEQQGLLVRQTAKSVFKHCESFMNGYMIVASDSPMMLDPTEWERRIANSGNFGEEIAAFETQLAAGKFAGVRRLFDQCDRQRYTFNATRHVISDDKPLVEYPEVVRRMIPLADESSRVLGN